VCHISARNGKFFTRNQGYFVARFKVSRQVIEVDNDVTADAHKVISQLVFKAFKRITMEQSPIVNHVKTNNTILIMEVTNVL
jgi:hypothetical protein